jgi:hypothetical protein
MTRAVHPARLAFLLVGLTTALAVGCKKPAPQGDDTDGSKAPDTDPVPGKNPGVVRPPTVEPNPRTIDKSRLVGWLDLLSAYKDKPREAEGKYTGQTVLCYLNWPDQVRDAEGRACVVTGADKGKHRPSLVVRLANENGWKEGARTRGELIYVEGRVVGVGPPASFPWMRDWAGLPEPGIQIPTKVLVIEDGRVVTAP